MKCMISWIGVIFLLLSLTWHILGTPVPIVEKLIEKFEEKALSTTKLGDPEVIPWRIFGSRYDIANELDKIKGEPRQNIKIASQELEEIQRNEKTWGKVIRVSWESQPPSSGGRMVVSMPLEGSLRWWGKQVATVWQNASNKLFSWFTRLRAHWTAFETLEVERTAWEALKAGKAQEAMEAAKWAKVLQESFYVQMLRLSKTSEQPLKFDEDYQAKRAALETIRDLALLKLLHNF